MSARNRNSNVFDRDAGCTNEINGKDALNRIRAASQRLHHVDDFSGTGIGLAIVQRIIRRHDGNIWAEAKAGEGATFFFSVKEAEHGSDEQDHPAG